MSAAACFIRRCIVEGAARNYICTVTAMLTAKSLMLLKVTGKYNTHKNTVNFFLKSTLFHHSDMTEQNDWQTGYPVAACPKNVVFCGLNINITIHLHCLHMLLCLSCSVHCVWLTMNHFIQGYSDLEKVKWLPSSVEVRCLQQVKTDYIGLRQFFKFLYLQVNVPFGRNINWQMDFQKVFYLYQWRKAHCQKFSEGTVKKWNIYIYGWKNALFTLIDKGRTVQSLQLILMYIAKHKTFFFRYLWLLMNFIRPSIWNKSPMCVIFAFRAMLLTPIKNTHLKLWLKVESFNLKKKVHPTLALTCWKKCGEQMNKSGLPLAGALLHLCVPRCI